HRYHPYARTPFILRSDTQIQLSLAQALANRKVQNWEGPIAIGIRNHTSHIDVPDTISFDWRPKYCGPIAFSENNNSMGKDVEEVLEGKGSLPTAGKASFYVLDSNEIRTDILLIASWIQKRKFEEYEEQPPGDKNQPAATKGSPAKKLRKSQNLIERITQGLATVTASVITAATSFQFTFSGFFPLSAPPTPMAPPETPSSVTGGDLSNDWSSDGNTSGKQESQSSSDRHARLLKKKARLRFVDPSHMHPKYGIRDALSFHQGRLPSHSSIIRFKKQEKTVRRAGPGWSAAELFSGVRWKAEWTQTRLALFESRTCEERLKRRLAADQEQDRISHWWARVVERYEIAWPDIDLAGVRARYIRPARNEISENRDPRVMSTSKRHETMRAWYPAWEHPAWDDVDESAKERWRRSAHYTVTVGDVEHTLQNETDRRSLI
ncbi:hypothetical protein FRB90_002246, partial [Tulasnella sp. 427]